MSRRRRLEGDIDMSLSARDKSDAGPPFREALFEYDGGRSGAWSVRRQGKEESGSMEYLLTAAEMAAADRTTSEKIGIPSIVLMERAALAVAKAVQEDFPDASGTEILIIAGKGNNGADALAAGRILLDAGYGVTFYSLDDGRDQKTDLSGESPEDFRKESVKESVKESSMDIQRGILEAYGCRVFFGLPRNEHPNAVIDGIFGTGLSRAVSGKAEEAIRTVNCLRERGARIYSVDIPSGVSATTGERLGAAVQADVTVTFSFYKRGHFLFPGSDLCGWLIREEIGITKRAFAETGVPEVFTYRKEVPMSLLPKRRADGNKGTFGKILVIAGSRGVSGACTMSAQAALRMGAGMVRVFTHEDNRVILQETIPEAMCSTYSSLMKESSQNAGWERTSSGDTFAELDSSVEQELWACLSWADAAVIGPGLGRSEGCRQLLAFVLKHADALPRGLVIDADAIRLLAEGDGLYGELLSAGSRIPVILTPHPAECAALFHKTVSEVLANRFAWLPEFAERFHCTIAGKDARTLVASFGHTERYLNTSGNDGLATAGSGDVLTGIAAACLGLGMEGFAAAKAAVYIHGAAADALAKERSRRSIMATDLIRKLGEM